MFIHTHKRDLKPENILFATEEIDSPIKIIDFGTSRKFSTKNMTKRLGTVLYHFTSLIIR